MNYSDVSINDLIKYHQDKGTNHSIIGFAVVRNIDYMFDAIIVEPIDKSSSIELYSREIIHNFGNMKFSRVQE